MQQIHAKGLLGPSPDKSFAGAFLAVMPSSNLPPNWSYEYLFDQIDYQGQTSSCVAHGTVGLIESFYYKRHGYRSRIEASRAAYYALGKRLDNCDPSVDDGMYVSSGLKAAMHGYVNETDWPFDAQHLLTPAPDNLWHNDFKVQSYANVPAVVDAMRLALVQHGPLILGLQFPVQWEWPARTAVLQADNLSGGGGHCMLIVGYSDTRQAFRIRNSWGQQWGDNGYAWLPYAVQTSSPANWPYELYAVVA